MEKEHYQLCPCQTRHYEKEQWQAKLADSKNWNSLLFLKEEKVKLISKTKLASYFPGSRDQKVKIKIPKMKHSVSFPSLASLSALQGNELKLSPSDVLIKELSNKENASLCIKFKAISPLKQKLLRFFYPKSEKFNQEIYSVKIRSSHKFNHWLSCFKSESKLRWKRGPSKMLLTEQELLEFLALPSPEHNKTKLEMESSSYLPCPKEPFNQTKEDLKRHLYVLGKTGMGKSSFLKMKIQKTLKEKSCLIVIDPHGDFIDELLPLIPESRLHETLLIDPSQTDHAIALNPLEIKDAKQAPLKTAALLQMFQKLAKGSWGPRLEYVLRNALLTLCLSPNSTLLDLPRILTENQFLKNKLGFIKDPELKRFWEKEFMILDKKLKQEWTSPILNKIGPLLSSPLLRNIFAQPKSKLNLEKELQRNSIILIKLSKGQLGEDISSMLGMIFISLINSSLLRRAHLSPEQRNLVHLYIDECQNFSTKTLMEMLSESRKYGLALTLANQYLSQHEEEIKAALMGNLGSLVCFRLSQEDAKTLAPIFNIKAEDLSNLAAFRAYARLLKNAEILPTFRFKTSIKTQKNYIKKESLNKLKTRSIKKLCRPSKLIEKKLKIRYN